MIHMVNQSFKACIHPTWGGNAFLPSGHHHPGVHYSSYNGTTADQFFYLFIAELAIVINEFATVVMACPYVSMKVVHGLPEAIVAQMSSIQNDVQSFHFFQ